ncbi:hypothetical protein BCJMU62_2487 [Bacillus cereus]|nr:hypothetical protein BCJMU62_2487 [Bacillus cereus]
MPNNTMTIERVIYCIRISLLEKPIFFIIKICEESFANNILKNIAVIKTDINIAIKIATCVTSLNCLIVSPKVCVT